MLLQETGGEFPCLSILQVPDKDDDNGNVEDDDSEDDDLEDDNSEDDNSEDNSESKDDNSEDDNSEDDNLEDKLPDVVNDKVVDVELKIRLVWILLDDSEDWVGNAGRGERSSSCMADSGSKASELLCDSAGFLELDTFEMRGDLPGVLTMSCDLYR